MTNRPHMYRRTPRGVVNEFREAVAVLGDIPLRVEIRDALNRWWSSCLTSGVLCAIPVNTDPWNSLTLGLGCGLAHVSSRGEEAGGNGVDRDAAALLLANFVGAQVANDAPSEMGLRILASLGWYPPAWEVGKNAFLDAVAVAPLRQPWCVLLQRVSCADLEPLTGSNSSYARSWTDAREPFDALGFIHHARSPVADIQAMAWQILLELDASLWLEALESLRHPPWVELMLLFSRGSDQPDLLLGLLHASSAIFQNGVWTGRVGFPVVLQELLVHLDNGTRRSPTRDALPEQVTLLKSIWSIILSRQDGVPLSIHCFRWLMHRRLQTELHDRWSSRSLLDLALESLGAALVAEGIGPLDIQNHWTRRSALKPEHDHPDVMMEHDRGGEGERIARVAGVSWLLAAIHLLNCAQDISNTPFPSQICDRLWQWGMDLMKERDPEIDRLASESLPPNSLAMNLFGLLASETTRPLSSWRNAWLLLEPQRRRATWGTRKRDRSAIYPSIVLVRVGLFAAVRLVKASTSALVVGEAHAIFRDCWKASCRIALTDVQALGNLAKSLPSQCVAFMPALFGVDTELEQALAPYLSWLAPDVDRVWESASLLLRNGVPPQRIYSTFSTGHVDLERVWEERIAWHSRTGMQIADDSKDELRVALKLLHESRSKIAT